MAEPYLIAHIVRGEPAFDVAIKLQIGDEEGWIIPTSGHRAYPYWQVQLSNLIHMEVINGPEGLQPVYASVIPYMEATSIPPNHPDHYTTHATPGTGRTDLLSLIPLKPVEPIKRRV